MPGLPNYNGAPAAAANPTPTQIQVPTNGLFRGIGDISNLYNSNGQVFNYLGLGQGANAGEQSTNAAANLKSQYGIDINSLPQVNMGDYVQHQNQTNGGQYGPSGFKFNNADAGSFFGPGSNPAVLNSAISNGPGSGATPALGVQPGSQPATVGMNGVSYNAQLMNQNAPINQQTSALQGSQGSQTDAQRATALSAAGLTPDQQANVTAGQTSALQGTQNGSSPQVPQTSSADQYLQAYLDSIKPSADVTNIQQQLANLQKSQYLSHQGLEGQAIATPFVTGQEAAVDKGLNEQQSTLTNQLAQAQARQQSAMDVSKAALDQYNTLNKPVSLGVGDNLVNPSTGATVAQGQSYSAKAETSNVLALSKAYPDAGILPTDTPDAAAVKASNSQSFQIKNSNQRVTWDPISGQMVMYQTKGPQAAANAGFSTPSTTGGLLPSQPSGSSSTGYKAGQLTQLLQSQGKTADDATLNGLWKQYGNGGTYANDTAHNSVIYNAMNGGGGLASGSSAAGNTSSSAPATLPQPTSYAQKAFATDFTSGGLSEQINAQNTAAGHLVQAYQLGQKLNNISLQGGNALKNWFASETGKAAINNYQQAHVLSANELSAAYGADTGAERTLNASIGDSNSSPAQILGNVQTATQLLSSKILSNVQQYKTAYGQDAPINLNWFISPTAQQELSQIGLQFHISGNEVGAYQVQKDGSYKKVY